LRAEAQVSETKIFFVDEAHFRADANLRGKWWLRGELALVDSTSPCLGKKATYYSGVCLETGEVESMEVSGFAPRRLLENKVRPAAFLPAKRNRKPGGSS